MQLQNKIVLVTGASRGIGRAVALEFGRAGAKVIVNYCGSQEKAEAVVAQIQAKGSEAKADQADVSSQEEVQKMFQTILDTFGVLDIVVNNAGITADNLLIRMKEEEWDRVMDTNLKSVFLVSKLAAKQMMRQRHGNIINMASVVGLLGNAGQANYVAAKSGVIGLTKTMARELAVRGIRVNAIAPGFIVTDMTENLSDAVKEQMLQQIPLKKLGTPEHIANVALFLASDQSAYMTGQILSVDGGMHM